MNSTFVKVGNVVFRVESVTTINIFEVTEEQTRYGYAYFLKVDVFFVGDGDSLTFYNEEAAQVRALFEGMALNITPAKD